MNGFLAFVVGPFALCVGLLALAATFGWQAAGELPAGARGAVLAKRATRWFIPLIAATGALLIVRLLLLS